MENEIEYVKVFMQFESDDLPVVYFYEVDLRDNRFTLREIDVFADRTVKHDDAPYRDGI